MKPLRSEAWNGAAAISRIAALRHSAVRPPRTASQRPPYAIVATLRKCIAMMPAAMRWKWALLAPVSVFTGIIEAGAAAAVFALIKIINDPAQMRRMPIAARIAAALPHSSPQRRVLAFIGLIAVYYLFKNLIVIAGQYLRHKITGESIAALKAAMLKRYLAAPYPFHLGRNSADLIWNTNFCVEMICGEGMTAAVVGSSEILTAAAITGVLLYTALTVTLIAGTLLVLVLAVLLRLTRRMAERLGTGRHELDRASLQTLQEALGGIKEIKALGREELFYRTFRDQQWKVLKLGYIGKTLENIAPLITEVIFVCGALAVIALVTGVEPARTEGLPLLALFGYAAFRIVPAANRVTWQVNRVRSAGPAVDGLYHDYLLLTGADWQPEADANGSGVALHDRIVIEHVTYLFPQTGTPALHDVCLTIGRGESVGVVGHTGAGKTTLIDLVVGLLRPNSGRILIDGVDLNGHLNSWRRCVGYVPQTIFLTDDNLRRNIALGIEDRDVDEQRLEAAVRMAQLERLVAALPRGLDTPVGERGVRLSGGARQRVGIARALYHNPDLLVFDEATSALDHPTEEAVKEAIEALHGKKTMLIVAHRLSSVRRCDRLVFLSNGRVKVCGSYNELLRDDAEFRRLATVQGRINPGIQLTLGMKRVLFVQYSLKPPGGGNGVAVWMLQALKDTCQVTLLTWAKPDLASVNRYFGTTLRPTDFDLVLASPWFRGVTSRLPTPAAMVKFHYLFWRCRRMAPRYDVAITADNEADMGSCGIQYVHFPRFYPQRPAVDLQWYHRFRMLLQAYYRIPARISGFSAQRMRRNVTLVNSEFIGRRFRAVHGAQTITLYPPAIGEFAAVPWEQRENGFLTIGRISPEKRIECAIDILNRVRAAGIDVHLHLVGVPDHDAYTDFVRGLVQANAAWVFLHENLSRSELLDLISTHRYGLHAMEAEPFGMAVAELLSGGCIPFVYNDGGQVEIVDHDPRLIYNSAEDAVDKIVRTLRDHHCQMALRERLAQRKELFSTRRFVLRVREIVAAAGNYPERSARPPATPGFA